ncbi:MAG: VOC family protein [Aggregatilineales bacterium]
MDLGTFSISLAVKDIKASRTFYEQMGFEVIDGNEDEKWLILKNGEAKIGLFEGMFTENILTFNPKDARTIQKKLKAAGISLTQEADEDGEGPATVMLTDPDGNNILIDQF